MKNKKINESELVEDELISGEGLIANVLQDVALGNPSSDVADEFISDFVLQNRDETAQILSLLESPSENLVELLKGIVTQGYQAQIEALNSKGFLYLESLKGEVRARLTALSTEGEG
jgi:hypothetical protein